MVAECGEGKDGECGEGGTWLRSVVMGETEGVARGSHGCGVW